MSGLILTRPQVGSGIPGTIQKNIIIPASPPSAPGSNIVIVDSCYCEFNISVKWLYTIYSDSKDKVVSGEVLAMHRGGANPSHSWYGITGDLKLLPHTLNVESVSNILQLKITNLSGNFPDPTKRISYNVNITRIQILI